MKSINATLVYYKTKKFLLIERLLEDSEKGTPSLTAATMAVI